MVTLLLVFICLVAIIVFVFISADDKHLLRKVGIYLSQIIYIISLSYLVFFDKSIGTFQLSLEFSIVPSLNIVYNLGVDGITIFLILLTTLLISVCILVSWGSIEKNVKFFLVLLFLTEFLLLNAFTMLNLFFFFIV